MPGRFRAVGRVGDVQGAPLGQSWVEEADAGVREAGEVGVRVGLGVDGRHEDESVGLVGQAVEGDTDRGQETGG